MKLAHYQVHRLGVRIRCLDAIAQLMAFALQGITNFVGQLCSMLVASSLTKVQTYPPAERQFSPYNGESDQAGILEQILGEIPAEFREIVRPYVGSTKAIWLGGADVTFGGPAARIVPTRSGGRLVIVSPTVTNDSEGEFTYIAIIQPSTSQICQHTAGSHA